MKQRLSLFNLFAMDGGGKVIMILLSYPAVIALSLYILKEKIIANTGKTYSEIITEDTSQKVLMIVFILYGALLTVMLCRIGIKKHQTGAYTIERLSVSEYEYCICHIVYGFVVFTAFWLTASASTIIIEKMFFMDGAAPGEFLVACRNCIYLRFLIPAGDKLQMFVLIGLGLASSVIAACDCCRLRHGRQFRFDSFLLYMCLYLCAKIVFYPMENMRYFDWRMMQDLIIVLCVLGIAAGVWGIVSAIRSKYEKEQVQ